MVFPGLGANWFLLIRRKGRDGRAVGKVSDSPGVHVLDVHMGLWHPALRSCCSEDFEWSWGSY